MRAIASVEKSLDAHVGAGLYSVVAPALTHAHIAGAHGKIESLYPHPLSLGGYQATCRLAQVASRKVLSWRLSNTMDSHFCVEALEDAIERHGIPEVFNTDQGSPFTSQAFIDRLKREDIQSNMDGKGRCLDNVFIERLWRSIKYEEVYLKAYTSIADAKRSLVCYFGFYNERRWHQALDKQTPDEAYYRVAYAMAA